MSVFIYRKTFYMSDKQAKELGLTYEVPLINIWQDDKDRWFMTNDFLFLKRNIKYHNCFDAIMTQKGWKVTFELPFIWENEYRWHKIRNGIYQLTTKSIKKEDITGDKQEKTTPLPRSRRSKTPTAQKSSKLKPTTYGKDADIVDIGF